MRSTEVLGQKFQDSLKRKNALGLFRLEEVGVIFNKLQALQGVNLVVSPGDFFFVTGASGAGKTTLLNVLASNVQPTTGKFFRSGINSQGKPLFVAEVFQDLRLMGQRTGEDNIWVSYDPSLYKSKNEFYKEMLELAQFIGAKDFLQMKMEDANGGLKQKISLLRALMSRPDVILADEPTSSLDRDNSYKMYELLNFFNNRRGTTVIWASHNRELIKQLHGKLVHLEKGTLVYSGSACFI